MDGGAMLYALRQLLEEDSDSGFIDTLTSYRFLNEAATDFAQRTSCLTNTQTITTVAETSGYNLSPDFIGISLNDNAHNRIIKYSDGTSTTWPVWIPHEDIIRNNNTTSVTFPQTFGITDAALSSRVTGTATATGAAAAGESTLTDSAGAFTTDGTAAGDVVNNTTDGSTGIVLSVTSATAIVTALYGGAANDWTSADAYVIQPQGRFKLVLDPPPSTAGHTITIYYTQRPAPVYSSYGMFRFSAQVIPALVKYAAWLYKYRDSEPDFGDKWFQLYDIAARRQIAMKNSVLRRRNFRMCLKAGG